MPEPAGFFSYVRADDEHDGGALSELRRVLAAEVKMQTGREFVIFQDRNDILWGQRWQGVIDRSLDTTTVLIAVLTPSYLQSSACREEVERFLERERALGRDDLILPVYYVETPALGEADDPIAVELRARNYVDWRELRFDSLSAPPVRRAMAQLAGQVVAAIERVNPITPSPSVTPNEVSNAGDDEPGFVELAAEAEDAMPLFTEVLESFSGLLRDIGALAEEASAEMELADARQRPAAGRLVAARRLASNLEAPVVEMEAQASDYLEQLARLDGGLVAMIARVAELDDEAEIQAARDLYESLAALADSAEEGLGSIAEFGDTLRKTGRISSTVRPAMRRMEAAVGTIVPSKETFRRWERDLATALDAHKAAGVAESGGASRSTG